MRKFYATIALVAALGIGGFDVGNAVASPDYPLQISTNFRGPDWLLDVYNGGPKDTIAHLTQARNRTGQHWAVKAVGNDYYKFSNQFNGQTMCLDVVNGGPRNNYVHMMPCAGDWTGQYWKVEPIGSGRQYRLTTKWRGTGMCMDVVNGGPDNNDVRLAPCGNYTGQMWTYR